MPVIPMFHAFATRAALAGLLGLIMTVAGARASVAADLPRMVPTPPPLSAPSLEPHWTFSLSAYVWATGLDGRLRTLPPLPALDVSIGFDQVLRNLDGGIMAAGEAQYGRAILFADVLASRISPSKMFYPAGIAAQVKVESGTTMALAAVGYRLVDDPAFSIDAFAGVRGLTVNTTMKVLVGPIAPRLGESEQWADAVGGARLKVRLTDAFSASLIAFAGGGGSRYEWDVFGGVNYAFNQNWSAFAGYRALKVDYRNGNFVFDALQHGPLFGVTSRF